MICIDMYASSSKENQHTFSAKSSAILCLVTEITSSLVATASLLATLLIAFDQYLAILFALRYHHFITYYRSWCLIATTWLVSSVVGSLSGVAYNSELSIWCDDFPCVNGTYADNFRTEYQLPQATSHTIGFGSVVFLMIFVLPTILLTIFYGRIYMEAHKNSQRMREGGQHSISVTAAATSYNVGNMLECALTITKRMGEDETHPPPSKKSQKSPRKSRSAKSSPVKEKRETDIESKRRLLHHSNTTANIFQGPKRQSPYRKIAANRIKRSQSYVFLQTIKHKLSNAGHFMSRHKEEVRTARISLVIVVLVLVCWLPYFVFTLLLRSQYLPFLEGRCTIWGKGLVYIFMGLYSVLSPGVFAYRCKSLQRELKKFCLSRSSNSHAYGGVGKEELAFLQAKHKALLEEQQMARIATPVNIPSNGAACAVQKSAAKSSTETRTPVRFTVGIIDERANDESIQDVSRIETDLEFEAPSSDDLNNEDSSSGLLLHSRTVPDMTVTPPTSLSTLIESPEKYNDLKTEIMRRRKRASSGSHMEPPVHHSQLKTKFDGWRRFSTARRSILGMHKKPALADKKDKNVTSEATPISFSCHSSLRSSFSSATTQSSNATDCHEMMAMKCEQSVIKEDQIFAASEKDATSSTTNKVNNKPCHTEPIVVWC